MWWWFLAIGGVLLLIIALILLSVVRVRVYYTRTAENDEVEVSVRALYNLARFSINVPTIKLKPFLKGIAMEVNAKQVKALPIQTEFTMPEMKRAFRKFRTLLNYMSDYKDWLAGTLQYFHMTKLRWVTRFGLGGAPETAWTSGVVWSLKGAAVGQLSRWVKLEQTPEIEVSPAFGQTLFQTETDVRFHVRVFWLAAAFAMLAVRVIRKEGGLRVWLRVLLATFRNRRTAQA